MKQTDFDGKFEYSNSIALNNSGSNENSIIVFPNPSSGIFVIATQREAKGKQSQIEIHTVFGEKVYLMDNGQLSIINSPLSIDLSAQPSGIYLIKITTEEGDTFSRKVIKQ